MKIRLALCLGVALLATLLPAWAQDQQPLRVFIRGGIKTHGPNQHDHPRFLGDWTRLLGERGLRVSGAMEFPSAAQLEQTDVLVIYAADGMKIVGDERARFEKFLQRGGGLVVIHDGVVSGDQHEWAKQVQGGAWRWDLPKEKQTKWYEGEVGLYFVNTEHPIVRGVSNFDWKDEIYYDLDMAPDANVLATSFHSVFVLAPQLWTYEKTWPGGTAPYRAFVSLPGHEYDVFNTPHYRAILLRGIAWAGKRPNLDALCKPEELASLPYPEGGPTHPDKAAAKLVVHPDFQLNLVAAEPLIEKVISLDWAPDGRLWVAETPEYPGGRTINRNDRGIAIQNHNQRDSYGKVEKEDRPAMDRIAWLEDTNNDGRMDRKQVFAQGLELVTSLVFHRDGVIVAQAPDILWLRDKNGDGRCDMQEGSEKITLYTGFGTFDTHAVINNFRWGLDGWVYGAVGYSAGQPKSPDGSREFGRITAGVIRFKPDGSALEQVASGSCNTWGFDFAPDGELFYTTATCGEHFLHIVLPEKALAAGNVGGLRASAVAPDHQKVFPLVRHTRPAYVQIDWVGMFTAASGSCLYNGGAWPDKFNGSHFVTEPTVSLVHNEFLRPTNATYTAIKEPGREDVEFLASADLWFRPIHTRVGPDGALYVVDFYNQAAIHNDTRGPAHGARNAATRPDRDHHLGRIWRVQHKQAKPIQRPALEKRDPAAWVKALHSPNGWVRDTAARLLREQDLGDVRGALAALAADTSASPFTRVAALSTLDVHDELHGDLLVAAVNDRDPVVRKNTLRLLAERDHTGVTPDAEAVRVRLNDPDPRAQLNAFLALSTFTLSPEIARVVVESWPGLKDRHLQSAAVGVAAKDPLLFVEAALGAKDPAFLADFIPHVVRSLANRRDPALAARLVSLLSTQPATADALKQAALEALAASLPASVVPTWSPDLESAFKRLLASPRPGLPGAVLPLIARWDKGTALGDTLKPVIVQLEQKLKDPALPDDQRGQIAINLLGVRRLDPGIIPAVAAQLGGSSPPALQKRIVDALGNTGDPAAGTELIAAYSRVPAELHEAVFGTLVKRADWANAVVQALADRKIEPGALGTANLFRLRTHPDKSVAARANEVIDALRGPEQKQKDELIAQFKAAVEKPGNLANGKVLYTANCAGCHVFKDEGRNLAPNLTGMGAHGPADLLIHIIDPNRVVEPNFLSVTIETKDDFSYDGVVERENNTEVLLRNATADYTIRKDNIRSRNTTSRSLMPEGFEALGAEGLRDLLAYICADELRYRILDLTPVFTANTSRGIYNTEESRDESLKFKKFGTIKVGDIPFDVISPAKSPTGRNVVVLKGGSGLAKSYPQKVEVKVGLAATKLHFLGGVGGWAWPYGGDDAKNLPAAKITLHFAGGTSEEFILRNGVDIADYIGSGPDFDVPGSRAVPDLMRSGQVRSFSRDVKGRGVIERITLESFDNMVAPTFVGITAELADGTPHADAAGSSDTPSAAAIGQKPIRALIVGGGSSHDFDRWFNQEDTKTLAAAAGQPVPYTDQPASLAARLKDLDVLYLSNNQPIADPAARKGIFDHVAAGKGLLLVHPALWYNWNDWPEYNRLLVGGGSRGHDKYGEFEVKVDVPTHPVMRGVPATFRISDELYYSQPDPQGSPIQVLATGRNLTNGKTYPVVWITRHPKGRIVCISLGHDAASHEHPAYRQLLKNALVWAAGQGD